MGLRVHSMRYHLKETVVIMEEGNIHYPRCPRCDMLVPWAALNSQYLNTAQHANGGERNRRRLSVEEYRAGTEASFQLYGFLLTNVAAFKYLGRILRARDFDCLAVVATLRKSINKWERMYRYR